MSSTANQTKGVDTHESTYITGQWFCTTPEQRTVHPQMTFCFLRSQRNSHQHAAETSTNQQRACPLNINQPDPRWCCSIRISWLYSGSCIYNMTAQIISTTRHYTGWAKKAGYFWDKTTLQQLMIERRVICQKFQNFVSNEIHDLHVSAIKYSLPNLHKLSITPKLHCIL